MRLLAILVTLLLLPQMAGASCRVMPFEGVDFSVCAASSGDDIRLFLNGPTGPFGGFSAVDYELAKSGQKLGFAMNAGMYQPVLSPVGLYVEAGKQLSRLITSDGPGNFGLLPNGVFCIGDTFSVVETMKFAKTRPTCRYASQSGPMLVIAGKEHPLFKPASDSLHIRNGAGVSADGRTAWFAISDTVVNFDTFARFFRDALGAPNALYFDGSISRLYAPEINRSGAGFAIGPIVGLVVNKGNP